MEVLHPTAELAPPNLCVICEETPSPALMRVIDTGQTQIIPFTDQVGRKYVCEKCGLTIANRLGYISNTQAKAAFHAAEAAADRLRVVKEKVLSAAEDIHSFATDVSLGTERAALGAVLEGEYVETPASKKKSPGRPRKVAVGGDAASEG